MSTYKSSMIVIYTLPGTGRYSDIVTTPTIWTQHIFFLQNTGQLNLCGTNYFDWQICRDNEEWIGLGTKVYELQTWQHTCFTLNMETGNIQVGLIQIQIQIPD